MVQTSAKSRTWLACASDARLVTMERVILYLANGGANAFNAFYLPQATRQQLRTKQPQAQLRVLLNVDCHVCVFHVEIAVDVPDPDIHAVDARVVHVQ